jgi:hypothetical protein
MCARNWRHRRRRPSRCLATKFLAGRGANACTNRCEGAMREDDMPTSPLELRVIWLRRRRVTRALSFPLPASQPPAAASARGGIRRQTRGGVILGCGWRAYVGSKLGPTRAQHYAHGRFNCYSASALFSIKCNFLISMLTIGLDLFSRKINSLNSKLIKSFKKGCRF